MLKSKTIQMDEKMIGSVEKKMVADRNFSFQAVTREYIEIGIEAERWKKDLIDLYVMARREGVEQARHIEDFLNLLMPKDFPSIQSGMEKELERR